MKLDLFIGLVISSFILFSCTNNRKKEAHEIIQNQTPEILDDSKTDISSISKRYSSDIVQDLFNEAVSKDNKLKNLTDNLNEIGSIKADSLKPYREYFQNNTAYWSSANRYISMISDSILKNDLKEIFKDFESKYEATISKHNYLIEKIEGKEKILNDYQILMKLSITIPMISSYQKNELPDLKALNNIVVRYDTLINETQNYSTIIK
jgi:hypothetical protein